MKELICISCPRGCRLSVDENLQVTGNNCPRGITYAQAELTNPVRMVTSTVTIKAFMETRLPVKTSHPISKDKIFEVMNEIKDTVVIAPIRIGDIVIKNVANTGVDVVATKSVLK